MKKTYLIILILFLSGSFYIIWENLKMNNEEYEIYNFVVNKFIKPNMVEAKNDKALQSIEEFSDDFYKIDTLNLYKNHYTYSIKDSLYKISFSNPFYQQQIGKFEWETIPYRFSKPSMLDLKRMKTKSNYEKITFKESNYKIRNFVGYYKLSRVVFLRNNEALVEIIKKYAGTDGGLYWLKKSNGKWEVKKTILIDYRIRNENF